VGVASGNYVHRQYFYTSHLSFSRNIYRVGESDIVMRTKSRHTEIPLKIKVFINVSSYKVKLFGSEQFSNSVSADEISSEISTTTRAVTTAKPKEPATEPPILTQTVDGILEPYITAIRVSFIP